jgi:glycosyltransferase involved in cell wall biosynthesis
VIGIALLTFASGRLGGSETYVRGLLAALHEHGSLEYVVALPPDEVDTAGGLPVISAGARSSTPRPVAIARAAAVRGVVTMGNVVHYPLTIALPRTSRPTVVTLHDTLHLDLPSLVPHSTRLFRRLAYDASARRADRVIVPSSFVRDRAVRLLGIDAERVRVIHHAVDTNLFRPGEHEREPFLLYPARAWPHKNHALLFEAFARVRAERPELELVLTGGGHDFAFLPAGVRSLGAVDVRQLADLYRRAAAVTFPSLYEGFGLPVLEAMASACPVVAIRGTPAEEVGKGAAVTLVEPDAAAFADGISRALQADDGRLRRGVDAASAHSWARVATRHEHVYRELL